MTERPAASQRPAGSTGPAELTRWFAVPTARRAGFVRVRLARWGSATSSPYLIWPVSWQLGFRAEKEEQPPARRRLSWAGRAPGGAVRPGRRSGLRRSPPARRAGRRGRRHLSGTGRTGAPAPGLGQPAESTGQP